LVSQQKVKPLQCPTNYYRESCWRCRPGE